MKVPTYPIFEIGDWVRIKTNKNLTLGGRVARIHQYSQTAQYDFCLMFLDKFGRSFIDYRKDEIESISNEEAMIYILEQ